MKKKVNLNILVMLMMLVGTTLCFTACSDDDKEPAVEPKVEDMYGDYSGKMQISILNAGASATADAATGVDVTATVQDNKVSFTEFPVRELIVAVLHDETLADNLLNLIGQVKYEVAYTPAIAADKATINITLNPQPLVISMVGVSVSITAPEQAVYTFADGKLQMNLKVESVSIGGEVQTSIPQMEFAFDLAKN